MTFRLPMIHNLSFVRFPVASAAACAKAPAANEADTTERGRVFEEE